MRSPAAQEEEERHVWRTAGHDLTQAPKRVWNDGKLVFTSGRNWLYLLGASAFALGSEQWEDNEAEFFEHHTLFSNGMQDVLGALGNGLTIYAGTLAWYFWASAQGETSSYEASKTVFSALTVTAVTTTVLKGLIHDSRPDGSAQDFPSGHASQTMALAASLDELYGPEFGVPAYVLSGLVGLQRLDTERHDTGSVVFGWVLGFVVGKTVASHHAPRIFGLDLGVTYEAEVGDFALSLSRSF